MYTHLLVPVDDSQLGVRTVGRAVEFAKSIGARITFLHARSGYGSTSLAALERVLAPADLDDGVTAEARGLLAKAQVAAQAAGVPCEAVVVSSDRPYEAILDTARERGCDLIFMASHGRRGMRALVLGSQTQKVLQNTTIPVLVSSVAGNAPEPAICAPLAVIIDEHRSIAAVIRGMERVVSTVREGGEPPPFGLLRAMLYYIKAFPEALHHPKENAYLFARLRTRTSEFDETLAELERQHAEGHEVVERLEQALAAYEANPAGGLTAFAAAVDRFATTQWAHMNLENSVILPAAQKHLTEEDWREIGAAFASNGDPRFSVDSDDEYRRLFARILDLVPR
jgi:nucleotide-binding universal stress UspA family protein/hemerythrin-like domain-containing protein